LETNRPASGQYKKLVYAEKFQAADVLRRGIMDETREFMMSS